MAPNWSRFYFGGLVPDTLNNIPIPAGVWVDLYAGSGITVGVKINVQCVSGTRVRLYAGASSPAEGELYGYRSLRFDDEMENVAGDAGAWAICVAGSAIVNVQVAI